jgi:hypothetical protein
MKQILVILFLLSAWNVQAQKVENIFFNLYTDSLKKGVHNYINVDGKLSNDRFLPLTSNEIILTSSAGKWDGNSLIIDSCYQKDSVVIMAVLKESPEIKKSVTIYMKKIEIEPELITEKELMEGWRREGRKRRN